MHVLWIALLVVGFAGVELVAADTGDVMARKTVVSIEDGKFKINGQFTYPGRSWKGVTIEGLLMNSRMVQGVFDDLNPETRAMWAYPDGPFDAERNTREFIAAMPEWKSHGLLAFTIDFQGGSPRGYSNEQPWVNSAFTWDGHLRKDYADRMKRIIDAADDLGMVVILGYFYFGQEPRMESEAAVIRACDEATDWVLQQGYTNVVIEIANESDIRYKHAIIKPGRGDELIQRVQQRSTGKVRNPAGRLLVSTSYGGGTIPKAEVVRTADFLLIHGNGQKEPRRIREMVDQTRAVEGYRGQPILFNEDDHFDFDKPDNNMIAAVSKGASWGYFDYRMKDEGFDEGYQSVPVNWGISSERKRGFFGLLKEMTGH